MTRSRLDNKEEPQHPGSPPRFPVTCKVYDDTNNLVLRFGGTSVSGDEIFGCNDDLTMEVIANYTEENKVTCLDFSLTTTPRLPCQASGEGPQSPKSEYLATEDELVIYLTSEQRRSSVLQSTLDDDIWLSVQDNQLDAVVIKHASERVSSG